MSAAGAHLSMMSRLSDIRASTLATRSRCFAIRRRWRSPLDQNLCSTADFRRGPRLLSKPILLPIIPRLRQLVPVHDAVQMFVPRLLGPNDRLSRAQAAESRKSLRHWLISRPPSVPTMVPTKPRAAQITDPGQPNRGPYRHHRFWPEPAPRACRVGRPGGRLHRNRRRWFPCRPPAP